MSNNGVARPPSSFSGKEHSCTKAYQEQVFPCIQQSSATYYIMQVRFFLLRLAVFGPS